jgi:hypothetical protein
MIKEQTDLMKNTVAGIAGMMESITIERQHMRAIAWEACKHLTAMNEALYEHLIPLGELQSICICSSLSIDT